MKQGRQYKQHCCDFHEDHEHTESIYGSNEREREERERKREEEEEEEERVSRRL